LYYLRVKEYPEVYSLDFELSTSKLKKIKICSLKIIYNRRRRVTLLNE
jgi:hypothetical protein